MRAGRTLAWAALGALAAVCAPAQTAAPPANRELVVGVFEAPPYAMKDSSGQWKGFTVDLWKDGTVISFEARVKERGATVIKNGKTVLRS